ncbi:MAG: CBS domain-containing protein [Candidatus Woesearchaeota archaeon]
MSFVKTAYDIARKKVFFCNVNDAIKDVANILHTNNIGSILVKDNNSVVGIITVNDILRQVSKNKDMIKLKAKEIMSSPVIKVNKDLEIDELAEEFKKHKVSRMVLIDDKSNIIGVVRDIAVFKYFSFFKYDEEARKKFGDLYSRELY